MTKEEIKKETDLSISQFIDRIENKRNDLDYSIKRLSDESGVSERTYQNIKSLKTGHFSNILKFALALGLTIKVVENVE